MLNFETSYTSRPLPNEHENLFKEIIYRKKVTNNYWSKIKLGHLNFLSF